MTEVITTNYQFYSCEKKSDLPTRVSTFKLTNQLTGEAAMSMINHLHGKGVTPTENLIGFYSGEGGTATLYGSRYANESESTQVMERMAQRIRQGIRSSETIKNERSLANGLPNAMGWIRCIISSRMM